MMRPLLWFCACLLALAPLPAQPAADAIATERRVTLVQRYDLRVKLNGRPAGLVYGFNQSVWQVGLPTQAGVRPVRASWFLTEDSINSTQNLAKPLSGELRVSFELLPDGSIRNARPGPAPFQRGFPPSLPRGAAPGLVWEAPGQLVVDAGRTGQWTTLPVYIQYKYLKDTVWNGRPVAELSAKYAIRYRQGQDRQGDPQLAQGTGSRESSIYLDPRTGGPIFVRERLINEAYAWADGKTVSYDGFILSFYEGWASAAPFPASGPTLVADGPAGPVPSQAPAPNQAPAASQAASPPASPPGSSPAGGPAIAASDPAAPAPSQAPALPDPQNRPSDLSLADPDTIAAGPLPPSADQAFERQVAQLNQAIETARIPDVQVKADPRGLAMNLGKLQFRADSAALLPGEAARLDGIAALLSKLPAGRNFLVVGHTADTNNPSGEKKLSRERALAIVEELKKRGLAAGRFLYDGRGATEPLADNASEAGKAQNRRVEIIVLE